MAQPTLPRLSWPTWAHSSPWQGVLLALVAIALLWAFHQVANDSVQQSELRLKTINAFNQATWHCNSLNSQRARKACLSQRPSLAGVASPEPFLNAPVAQLP